MAAAVLEAAGVVSPGGRSAAAVTIPRGAVRITIAAAPRTRPLPAGYIGLSIEYPSAVGYFGPAPSAPNAAFLTLVRLLTPGQSPVIRFGGDTTDWTWAPTPGVARPPGIRYTLGPRWMRSVQAGVSALGARVIPGINLESDSPAIAAAESEALLGGLGQRYIAGFELGNEPELYGTLGWYTNSSGVGVPGRPSGYGFAAYLPDYARVSAAMPRSVPLVGPASGAPVWLASLARYLAANPRVRTATFHRYPLHRCFTAPGSPAYPSIPNLLAPGASVGLAATVSAAVATAHARGIPFRVDELNSVSCGGARGVSDTFASALWVLDTLFAMDAIGVDGINVHTFGKAIYEPFAFSHTAAGWIAQVRPMYYGMLMFARAAPPGSRLLSVSRQATSTLRIWATRAPDGTVRAVLINDAFRRPVTVALRPPRTFGGGSIAATVSLLRAPHIGSRSGVTIGGQSFGASTSTGALPGTPRTATLTRAQGALVVRVPPATAALVTLGRG